MRGPGRFVFFDSRPERKPGAGRSVTRLRVRAFAALVLAAGLSMASVAFFATAAQAQMGEITLVRNLNQTVVNDHNREEALAQSFTTGTEPLGYVLTSVDVVYQDEEGDTVSAKVCTVSFHGQPTNRCTGLTAPASFASGTITFTVPGGMLLKPDREYTLVLTPDEPGTEIKYGTTQENTEDGASLPGWDLPSQYRYYDGMFWVTDEFSHSLRIHLKGAIAQDPDAIANASATGAPAITGPAQVGRTLTAGKGTIDDPDGLLSDTFPTGYSFQWIRVETNSETDIPGATSATYTPVFADENRTLKVRVGFLDRAFTLETLTGGETQPVVPDAAPCPAVSVWCTVLTSGTLASGGGDSPTVGFRGGSAFGGLDDDTFTFGGTTYSVTELTSNGASAINLNTAPLLPADGGGLTLHVQKFTGTLDLELDDAFSSPHTGTTWNWNDVVGTGAGNPVLLRMFRRVNERYQGETDAGTRVTVWLSGQPGVSFEAPAYVAYEAGEGAEVTVTLTPTPTSPVTIQITATGQDGASSADWSGIPSNLTFAVGESSKTFTVTAVNDTDEDAGESVLIEFGTLPSGVAEGYLTTTVVHFFDRASPGDARLVGESGLPTTDGRGLVQMFYRMQGGTEDQGVTQGWGTVCDDRMDRGFTVYDSNSLRKVETNYAPTLLCKMMGFETGVLIMDNSAYPMGNRMSQPIWLDDLRCDKDYNLQTGEKKPPTQPDHCFHAGIGRHNCSHSEDVVLQCTGVNPDIGNQVVAEPLRVAFVDVPKTGHDGETAFTFGLDFSEAVAITAEDMRDHALEVSGATVTSAALADGSDELWEIMLQPSGTDSVVITVAGKDSCSDTGALCTSLGAGLENRLSTVLPYVPPSEAGLTAEFLDVPAEHSGDSDSTLRVELLFSEDVKVSNNRMRRQILKLENATLEEARRIDRRKDYWEFSVRPTSHRAIVLSLASAEECGARDVICTFDGSPLSEPATATIIGPPGLSVADAEVEEGPDAKLAFVITLDRAATGTVTVDASTSDGTAVAGEDYRAKTLTKTFAPGETRKVAVIRVLDDSHNEDPETMTLTLSNPVGAYIADGEAVGTITNTDAMPQAWLARFGRTVADQVLEAVEGRMTAARSPGMEVSVAGRRIGAGADAAALEEREARAGLQALSDWFRGVEEEENGPESRALTNRDLLVGSSFALTGGSGETGFGSVWGRGAVSRFDGREGDLTLDGEVESALLGTDYARGRGMLGLVLSHSRGSGGYRAPSGGGAVESTLTGVYPWGRYEVSERLSAWGVVGYGAGTLTLTPAGQTAIETDMDLSMAAVGARGVLAEAPAGGGLELAATSDAMAVRTTSEEVRGSRGSLAASEADVTRLRVGLEGAWRGPGTAGGGSFVPSVEIGMRHDGGDAETGFGADIGAGLAWTDPGLGIEAQLSARGLLTHEDGDFGDRGFAGQLAWDPEPSSDRGPSLTLSQTVGSSATGGADALLRPDTARLFEAANEDENELDRRRFEARLGYGWASFGGRYTTVPAIGLGLTEATREYIHSWRLAEAGSAGLVLGLDLEAVRLERMTGDVAPEHRFVLGLGWRLEKARREDVALEFRFEGARLEPANENAEHRIGLTLTARW